MGTLALDGRTARMGWTGAQEAAATSRPPERSVARGQTHSMRVSRMEVQPDAPGEARAGAYVIADLEPAPPRESQWWWTERLLHRVRISASGGSDGHFRVHFRVPLDQLEVTARRLLTAVEEASSVFPSEYEADRHARESRRAAEAHEREEDLAPKQAILDRLMEEYRSSSHR